MTRERVVCLLLCLLVGLNVGCASVDRSREFEQTQDRVLLDDVPFYPDDRYWCGPATLSSVLNYHGAEVSVEDVADEVYSESARGTAPFDMVWYARERGFEVKETEGTHQTLRKWLERDRPVIVFTDVGNWMRSLPHYMVVVGISNEYVAVHSGTDEQKVLPRERFKEVWAKQDFWMMVVQ